MSAAPIALSMHDEGDGYLALMVECETPAQLCEGGPFTLAIMENTENERAMDDESDDDEPEAWQQEQEPRDWTVLVSMHQREKDGIVVALSVADLDAFVTNLTTLRDQARAAGILAGGAR